MPTEPIMPQLYACSNRPPVARAVLGALALAAALAVLAGCRGEGSARGDAGSGGGGGDAASQSAGTPRRGGTLVTGWTGEPAGVNELIAPPQQLVQELVLQVFLRLVEEQPDFEQHPPTFKPQLARSYDWSPDHRTLTLHLRDDAVWSDGVPVTADDVRWTWQAQTSPDVAWNASYMKSQITDVEAVDPHTVRFHFQRAYAKQLLDVNEGGILPHHVWGQIPFAKWRQSGDWFKQHLVTDGPFVIESWKPRQEIVLRRNERYYDRSRPFLDRMVIRVIPDQANLMTQLASGDIDFSVALSPNDASRVAANPRLGLLATPSRTWVAIAWNGAHAPFSEPEVRRAMGMALDRPAIVQTLWGRFAQLCESPILNVVWAYDHALKPLPHDPAAARRLLAARGFTAGADGVLQRGGKPLAFEVSTNTGNQQRADALVMIQAQLRQIGVRAEPRLVEFNTLGALIDKGTYDAALVGNTMDTSLDLSGFFSTRSIGDTNSTHYSNPEIDRLIDHSMSLPDVSLAKPDLDRIQEILQRDQPYTFLWESERLCVFDRRLHGLKPGLVFAYYNLRDWWVEPKAVH
jgi:peptide/nickel transport system substrate-binding protein